jgi:hypothetical protein
LLLRHQDVREISKAISRCFHSEKTQDLIGTARTGLILIKQGYSHVLAADNFIRRKFTGQAPKNLEKVIFYLQQFPA